MKTFFISKKSTALDIRQNCFCCILLSFLTAVVSYHSGYSFPPRKRTQITWNFKISNKALYSTRIRQLRDLSSEPKTKKIRINSKSNELLNATYIQGHRAKEFRYLDWVQSSRGTVKADDNGITTAMWMKSTVYYTHKATIYIQKTDFSMWVNWCLKRILRIFWGTHKYRSNE